jgi:TRAP-type C4-dicarboxylate transport system substrate-binding protein
MRRLALLAVAMLLSACGPQAPGDAARGRKEVIVSADAPAGSAAETNWKRFAQNVGVWAPEYALSMRLGAEAGTPAQRAADVRAGAVQIAALPPDVAAAIAPELRVLSAPGLFGSEEEADFVLDRAVLEPCRRLFSEKGLRLIGWIDDDWTDPTTRETWAAGVIVANKGWFERLTPHDRDVFAQAYASAGQARVDSRAARRDAGAAAPAGGLQPAPAGVAAASLESLRDAHAAIVGQAGGRAREIYDLVLKGKQDFAAGSGAAQGN